jgi:hypothetical protein
MVLGAGNEKAIAQGWKLKGQRPKVEAERENKPLFKGLNCIEYHFASKSQNLRIGSLVKESAS